ncbi:unnamed protein product [Meloidogyne enterolobii]|uniref:Uncharacterized protein n=1 Tax=Meloidogyne enterolobii TaxID=390850 RepID=A0ACB0XPH7_MELEN
MNKNINRPSSRSTSRCSRGQQKKSEKKQKQQHNQLKINKSNQLNFWIPTSEKIVRKAYSSGGGGFVDNEENTKEEKE